MANTNRDFEKLKKDAKKANWPGLKSSNRYSFTDYDEMQKFLDDKKELEVKELEVKENEVKEEKEKNKFKGNREVAKNIWKHLRYRRETNSDFETWLSNTKGDKSIRQNIHDYLVDQGEVTNDYNTWNKNVYNDQIENVEEEEEEVFDQKTDSGMVQDPSIEVLGVPFDININAEIEEDEIDTDNYETELNDLVSRIETLKDQPILNKETGKVDRQATKDAIKELTDQFPSSFNYKEPEFTAEELPNLDIDLFKNINLKEVVVDDVTSGKVLIGKNRGEDIVDTRSTEIRKIKATEKRDVEVASSLKNQLNEQFKNTGYSFDVDHRESVAGLTTTQGANMYGVGMTVTAPNGETLSIDTRNDGFNDENQKLIKDFMRDNKAKTPKEIEKERERLRQYNAGEIDLSTEELNRIATPDKSAVALIRKYAPNIKDIPEDDTDAFKEAYSDALRKANDSDPRFKLITNSIKDEVFSGAETKSEELRNSYDTSTEEGLALASADFSSWYNEEFQKRLKENKDAKRIFQEYGLAGKEFFGEYSKEYTRYNYDTWLRDNVLRGIDESIKEDNGEQSFLSKQNEAFASIPSGFTAMTNKVEVAMQEWFEWEKRSEVYNGMERGFKDGSLNRKMTLREAKKINPEVGSFLKWRIHGWDNNDTLGEFYDTRKKRWENTRDDMKEDLDEMQEAEMIQSAFNTFDSNDFSDTVANAIKQAPHMAPTMLGSLMIATGTAATVASGGSATPITAGVIGAGKILLGVGTAVMAAQTYGDTFIEGTRRQMEEEYGEDGFTTQEYLDALGQQKYGDQFEPILTAAAVAGTEYLAGSAGSKLIGQGVGNILKSNIGKKLLGKTFSNYIGTVGGTVAGMYAGAAEEAVTEGFQSYLEQVGQNAMNISGAGDMIGKNAFNDNIDMDQIQQEARMGWNMGKLFGVSGVAGSMLSANVDNSYAGQAMRIASGIDFSRGSKNYKVGQEYFKDLVQKVLEDKNLSDEQKASQIKDISAIRNASMKVPKGIDPNVRGKLINLIKERNLVDGKIKEVNDKDLTQSEIARSEEISNEIKDIVANNTAENALMRNINTVKNIIGKSSKGKTELLDFKNAKELNAYVKKEGLKGFTRKMSGNQGNILINPKTGEKKILINREVSIADQNVNVAGHEFLHGLLYETLQSSPETMDQLGSSLDTYLAKLKGVDATQVAMSKYQTRVNQYLQSGNEFTNEEKLTLFSDALTNGDIKFEQTIFTDMMDGLRRILQNMGVSVKFNDAKDVYNFIKDYNKSIEKGELTTAQSDLQTTAATGTLVDNKSKSENKTVVKESVSDSYDQTNELMSDEDFDITAPFDTKRALKAAGAVIETTTKRLFDGVLPMNRQGVSRNDFKRILESEYINVLGEYNADQDTNMQGAGKQTSTLFNLRANKLATENFKQTQTQSLDDEKASQVVDETSGQEFDETAKEDRGRKKVYASQTDQVGDLDTAETKAIIKDEVSKDILLAANKGKNAADTARDIANESKKNYFKRLRKDIGTFASQKYKDFVNSLDKNFIKSLPVGTIKRRFGKLFGIKQTGTTPTKQTSKTGKPSYFNKPVYNVPKVTVQGLQDFKDYFLGGEKRQQSLYNILATDFALESIQELMADKAFMKKLDTALGNDGITSVEFMENIENKLDARTAEDSSFDVVKASVSDDVKAKEELKTKNQQAKNKINKNTSKILAPIKGQGKVSKTLDKFAETLGLTPFPDLSRKDQLIRLTDFLTKDFNKIFNLKQFATSKNLASAGNKFSTTEKYKQLYVNTIKGLETLYSKGVDQNLINDTLIALKEGDLGTVENLLELAGKSTVETSGNITKAISKKELFKQIEFVKENITSINLGRVEILDGIRKALNKDVLNNLGPVRYLLQSGNNNYNWFRNLSTLKGFMDGFSGKNDEHVLQAGVAAGYTLDAMLASDKIYSDYKGYFLENYFQVQTGKNFTEAETTYLERSKNIFNGEYNEDSWAAKDQAYPLLNQQMIRFLKGEISINQVPDSLIRYFNKYFAADPSSMYVVDNKGDLVTVAELYNVVLPKDLQNNPQAKLAQQKALFDLMSKVNLNEDIAVNEKLARQNFKNELKLSKEKQSNVVSRASLSDGIFTEQQTSLEQKNIMINSLETVVKASLPDQKSKGISVFDFDDTLAKTNSKVIVTMPDGNTSKIDATEFAKNSIQLEQNGATFNFDEFNKVVDGKKGPLADLALKRQGKFGSGDIFVLTARPQLAAEGIKSFLDGIGLNLPIENITGLENGSPQAKAQWILSKTAEGYNDFYFADDAVKNVKAVQQILDQVDVKSDVVIAKASLADKLSKDFNKILEETTGKEAYKTYSESRAKLEGDKKDKGLIKWLGNQLTITPSAEDFMGLLYDVIGKGELGNQHKVWIKEHLIDPMNKAEQELLSAKVGVANDFAALRKKFPSLKTSKLGRNPLLKSIGVGPYNKSQAMRVYMWAKQGMDIPGLSKRDQNALIAAVEADSELKAFADNVILIQKEQIYPAPGANWVAGNISSDIMQSMDKGFRNKLLTQFNTNLDTIFSPDNMSKLQALYGTKWVEALRDSIRRMKAGSNRPVYQGGGSRVVNELLDWLNGSVGAIMFLNTRSGLLQLTSAVNFINWGDNNIYAAGKAFANQPQYWSDVIKLMNSDYLVNRRDGLKINVNEAELVDAGKKGGMKGALAYFLDKGFLITRVMDSLAIGTGGATFFRNRINALLKRQNPKTGKTYTKTEAEAQAFSDFYAIAEESQQSSNPSKISQQQASLAGRVILSFQNTTMQYMRMNKKAIRDLYNRRKNPGQTQRESDLGNISKIMYYTTVQNVVFHSLQQALFAGLFEGGEEGEEEENKTAGIANGMLDSLLFGLGFGGAAISTVKNVMLELAKQDAKKVPKYEEAVWSVFDFSPVLDSKIRKLKSGLKSFSWNRDEMKKRGWSIDNPAYLAIAQIIASGTNAPLDRILRKIMNIRAALDEETRTWQKVALTLGWDTWSLGLPYWGLQSTIRKEEAEAEKVKADFKTDIRKLKADGYKKTMTPEKFDNVVEMKSPYGTVMYYYKIIKK